MSDFKLLTRPRFLLVFSYYFTVSLAAIGVYTFLVILFVDGFGFSEAIGNTALTTYMVLASVGVLTGGVVADRWDVYLTVISTLPLAAGFLIAVLVVPVSAPWLLVALVSVVGFWFGITIPARDSIVSLLSPADSLGISFGFATTGISLAGIISPVVFGLMIDVFDVFLAFAFMVVGFVLAAALIVPLRW